LGFFFCATRAREEHGASCSVSVSVVMPRDCVTLKMPS
jgi:hypothetical protein